MRSETTTIPHSPHNQSELGGIIRLGADLGRHVERLPLPEGVEPVGSCGDRNREVWCDIGCGGDHFTIFDAKNDFRVLS